MKTAILILLTVGILPSLVSQNIWITKKGQISFFSKTPLENIEAVNSEVSSVMNMQNGDIVFAVLIKGFHFQRALMEDHFNENYMESDKLPKAILKGKITNFEAVNLSKDDSYPITVEGELTIHGITQKITIPGTIIIKAGTIEGISRFKIKEKDYNIKVPSIVSDKIAESIDVMVDCKYELKK